MDKIIVLIGAMGVIGLIYWFFLGKKDEDGQIMTDVKITVSGGYSPALVRVPAGKEVTITLARTDPTDCLEEFVIPDLKIKRSLELNKEVTLKIKLAKPGRYEFHCGMNMYKGAIVAV
ncbi:cupredoxin domain-containing protein [Candidatus Amesbacteria bacterium]|nr:cupredoxin domain-containing protein [Candidatus Amesbacteria bacterium]